MDKKDIAKMIDHTNLSPTATIKDIEKLCVEADKYGFATVCINPFYVKKAAEFLKNSASKVCTVVGFPLGMATLETIKFETLEAIKNGATEIDMVINQGLLKEGDTTDVYNQILGVRNSLDKEILKVILETSNLSDEEIVTACNIAVRAGVDFVKTSTGFIGHGATLDHVKLMKETVDNRAEVKASGGIRSYEDALLMIQAGASRLGTSSGVSIVSNNNSKNSSNY